MVTIKIVINFTHVYAPRKGIFCFVSAKQRLDIMVIILIAIIVIRLSVGFLVAKHISEELSATS